ncbi:hypothetical protein [Dyella flagellata]|uniref:Dolichyl-phosphate-mannose-protein mannosyltransferase n=1 Tax=Dyella flagellata TaxID=1867833 RepID=A0ABQ5XCZ4_9GAMM|nr:hypothetical protein [Dyella flagellata]GLQ89561.1 hypothetical protein GCM10007898_31350 [Dyella flagellata]
MNLSPTSKWSLDKQPWLGICLTVGALLSIKLKQDASWDLKNYHLYNAWALLNDRYARDLVPASMQSYFNPLLDLPYYLLSTGPLEQWPRLLAAVQGLWFGALCYVVLRIAFRLAEYQGRKPHWGDLIAVLIGVSGTMAVSQTGGTSNEIALAFFVLLGLYLLMPLFHGAVQRPLLAVWLAGLSCGLAAGLKPTAIVYLPALGLAVLLAPATMGRRLKWGAAFTVGAALAFLLSYGWWGWHLYRLSGNPVFPLFNQIFRSDLIPPMSTVDARFLPRDAMQWVFYPFYWLHKRASLVTEPPFADPRYALTMLSLALIAVFALLGSRRKLSAARTVTHPVIRLFGVFLSLSYLFWLVLFSILRYAVAIEALTGIVMLMAVQAWIFIPRDDQTQQKIIGLSMGVLLVLIAATTHYPGWGRIRFGKQVFAITTNDVPPGSLVLLGGIPSAYLIPFFPHSQQIDFIGLNWFVQVSDRHRLWNTIQQRLEQRKGPLYIVLRQDDKDDLDLLHSLTPDLSIGDCRPILSNLDHEPGVDSGDLRLCLAHRGGK